MNKTLMLAAALMTAAPACADTIYNWSVDNPNHNPRGGAIQNVDTTFNATTNNFQWETTFGDADTKKCGGDATTDGFWLVVSPGPNPKGHPGELSVFFFDASDAGNPILTAYAYNGLNGKSSFYDGSPAAGTQKPDRIASSVKDSSWINSLTVNDNADGTRTLGFDIDATVIQDHMPILPGPGGADEWSGTSFGPQIGVWFHQFANLDTSYADGYLSSWTGCGGWLDNSYQNAVVVPVPPAALLGVAGLAGVAVRRRRKAQRA